jgi:hypothetical protein
MAGIGAQPPERGFGECPVPRLPSQANDDRLGSLPGGGSGWIADPQALRGKARCLVPSGSSRLPVVRIGSRRNAEAVNLAIS